MNNKYENNEPLDTITSLRANTTEQPTVIIEDADLLSISDDLIKTELSMLNQGHKERVWANIIDNLNKTKPQEAEPATV